MLYLTALFTSFPYPLYSMSIQHTDHHARPVLHIVYFAQGAQGGGGGHCCPSSPVTVESLPSTTVGEESYIWEY